MRLKRAMQALSDEQLHTVHTAAQAKVADRVNTGYTDILGEPTRIALAAQKEILARNKYKTNA